MLLELAIGDAYGAGFEYAPDSLIRQHNTARYYIQHPRHGMRPGSYTDDTQMSLAVAEALVSGEAWTPHNLARRFVEAFKRDPREGYAGGFYQFLQAVTGPDEFLEKIRPDSDKSGAAMRAAPLGVLPTVHEVLEKASLQAAITHNTPDGIHAAQAAALMTHYFLYEHGPKESLGVFLEKHVPGEWATSWRGKVGAKGWMSVRAAVTAVVQHQRLDDLLRECIAFTGDVDTVATIALAAAACSSEYAKILDEKLVDDLETGPYGKEYLLMLDAKLLALVKR
jgi:ADP-ribosylglycohydrolase